MSRLKIAYFSPLNPVKSGISDYSEELLPALATYADLDLFVDGYTPDNAAIRQNFAVFPADKYKKLAVNYDTFLFHMGNSPAHAYIYRALQQHAGAGILVLHDFVLHHFFISQYLNTGKAPEYIRLMAQYYGSEGEQVAREVIKGKLAEALFRYPLNQPVIEGAKAVLVHSRFAQNAINAAHPQKQVGIARMGVPPPPLVSQGEARARLGLPLNEFIVVSMGHLNPYKRLDSALWSFRAFQRDFPTARFVLVGSESPNYNVRAMISALGLEKSVSLVGYASMEKSQDYLAAADCCLNLRYPTAGETSASLLRIMGAGRPVMVSRTGAFEELPDEVCIKVDVDDSEEDLLLEYMRLLARRPDVQAQLGKNARRHVLLNAQPAAAAHDYYNFICQVLNRRPEIAPPPLNTAIDEVELATINFSVKNKSQLTEELVATTGGLNGAVAQAAVEIGMSEEDPAIEEVAAALRFVQG